MADANPNPIIEVDFQGQIVYLNAAAKIKFPDLNKLQALHPILQNLVGERTPKEGTSFVREIQIENSFFEQHIHYLKESECLRSYLFEITKYRKREIKLTTGKDRYRFFFEQSTEGILVINPDTKHIVEANQAYCKLLGYSSAEIIGCNLYQLLEIEKDLFNQILEQFGLSEGIPWLTSPKLAIWSVMLVTIWKGLGYYMVIYLAGLQAIPEELYEAAAIDGSDGWLKHWDITIPLMRPYLLLVAVISSIAATKVFEEVYIMTQGGPLNRSKTIVYYVYERAFEDLDINYACTIGLILFLIILILSFINLKISKNPTL